MNKTTVQTDGRARSTGPYMYKMVERYHRDMLPYSHFSLSEIFDILRSIPYRPDPITEETLMRPLYTMTMQGTGGDCDDKAIAIAAWAYNRGGRPFFTDYTFSDFSPGNYDYRFVAAKRKNKNSLHHVYTELYINNRWVPVDPTYSFNILGRQENYAKRVVI